MTIHHIITKTQCLAAIWAGACNAATAVLRTQLASPSTAYHPCKRSNHTVAKRAACANCPNTPPRIDKANGSNKGT